MHFPHIFLFTSAPSKGCIAINAISIFNNQPFTNEQQRHENCKIKIIGKLCRTVHSLSSQCLGTLFIILSIHVNFHLQ